MDEPNLSKMVEYMNNIGLRTDNEDFVAHFITLCRCQEVYQERYKKYRDLPIRAMGWSGVMTHIRTCVERLWAIYPLWSRNEAVDIVNYAVHYIRQGEENNQYGTWGHAMDARRESDSGATGPGEDRV